MKPSFTAARLRHDIMNQRTAAMTSGFALSFELRAAEAAADEEERASHHVLAASDPASQSAPN